jgi:putative endonuclease
MCYVYLLRSISDPTQTYTGFTRDLRHRLTQHNCGHSTHTRKFMPWELVFYAAFQEEVAARKFESYLKSGSGRAFAHKRLLSGIRGGCNWSNSPPPHLFISVHTKPLHEGAGAQILARNHSPGDDCRSAHLRRYSLGAAPISRLKTRLKELSEPYPTADATSENDVLFERIMPPALYIRHCVMYSRGVWPRTVLNFRAKADLDMRASRASNSTDQLLSRPECIASMDFLSCLSDMAANHPFGGAAELLA